MLPAAILLLFCALGYVLSNSPAARAFVANILTGGFGYPAAAAINTVDAARRLIIAVIWVVCIYAGLLGAALATGNPWLLGAVLILGILLALVCLAACYLIQSVAGEVRDQLNKWAQKIFSIPWGTMTNVPDPQTWLDHLPEWFKSDKAQGFLPKTIAVIASTLALLVIPTVNAAYLAVTGGVKLGGLAVNGAEGLADIAYRLTRRIGDSLAWLTLVMLFTTAGVSLDMHFGIQLAPWLIGAAALAGAIGAALSALRGPTTEEVQRKYGIPVPALRFAGLIVALFAPIVAHSLMQAAGVPMWRWTSGTAIGQTGGRAFSAIQNSAVTRWVRNILPIELDARLTTGEVVEDAWVYRLEGERLVPRITVERADVIRGRQLVPRVVSKRLIIKAGMQLKTWEARPELHIQGEPTYKVALPDEMNEFVQSDEELYVVAKKVRLAKDALLKAGLLATGIVVVSVTGALMIFLLSRFRWWRTAAVTAVLGPVLAVTGFLAFGANQLLAGYQKPQPSTPPTPQPTPVLAARVQTGEIAVPPEAQQYVALVDKHLVSRPTVPRNLVLAMIDVESRWDLKAISPKQAKGLMQLMDATWQDCQKADPSLTDVFDPDQNIRCGLKFFDAQLREFSDTGLALAAYNWGPEHIRARPGKSWADIAPEAPQETQDFVRKVIALARGGGRQPAVQTASARTFLTAVGSCRDDVSVHRLIGGKPDPVPEMSTRKGYNRAFQARWGSDYVVLRRQDGAEVERIRNAHPPLGGELFVRIDCPGPAG